MIPTYGQLRPELFETVFNQFITHLSKDGNDRILFSGKYGIGKSLSLHHFFKPNTQTERIGSVKYRSFHVFPVNYSIATNEDIFSYIKYDVINSMLLNKIELHENDFKKIDCLPNYLKRNWKKILMEIISMLPKVGKSLSESHNKIKELYEEFSKYADSLLETESDKLVSFLEEIEQKEGSLFENDLVSGLICSILTRYKETTNQENVLIIDDLDRIDPAHVFRILNVFAAHLDNPKSLPNKLGFDKVILVCDINNLRSIFKSNYGIYTDFNGYIDKFYSHEIFHFDNRKVLLNIAREAFQSVSFGPEAPHHDSNYKDILFRNNSLPLELLENFIAYGFINLRSLLPKMINKMEINPSKHLRFDDYSTVSQINALILSHFNILQQLLGGYEVIKEYSNRIPARGFHFTRMNDFCNQLLYFVRYEETFRQKGEIGIVFNEISYNMKLPTEIRNGLERIVLYPSKFGVQEKPIQYNYTTKDFKQLLDDFLDLLIRIDNY